MIRSKTIATLAGALALALTPAFAQSTAEDLRLTVGKSVVIDYAGDIRQISTSNPEVIDASPITTREILLHGKGFGNATMVVWSKTGQRTFYNVTVDLNLEQLRKLMKETFPDETINIQASKDSVSLTGMASSPAVAEKAGSLAASFAKQVVNNLSTPAPGIEKQIVLRVKFAELNRNAATQFAVNIVSAGAGNTIGRVATGQFPAPSPQTIQPSSGGVNSAATFSVQDALNIFAFRPDLNLAGMVKALQSRGVLQILAEPNLVTSNGKEAYFLVGGEFPVPVLQGGGNNASVTVQFKEFGVRLRFTPTITVNKTIKLELLQEVSSVDLAQGVSFNGFVIPAISTRRTQTGIELGEGQSFIVSGLIDNRDIERFSKIPGLASLPVFGHLFKSREIQKSLSELVVMVTPEITVPLNPGDAKPTIDFPNEFLVPLKPSAAPAKKASLDNRSTATVASNLTGGKAKKN